MLTALPIAFVIQMFQRQEIPIRWDDFAWLTNVPLIWTYHNYSNMCDDAAIVFVGVVTGYALSSLHFQLKFLDEERIKESEMKGNGQENSYLP